MTSSTRNLLLVGCGLFFALSACSANEFSGGGSVATRGSKEDGAIKKDPKPSSSGDDKDDRDELSDDDAGDDDAGDDDDGGDDSESKDNPGENPDNDEIETEDGDLDTGTISTSDDVLRLCESARVKEYRQTIKFPPSSSCSWSVNDNLAPMNGHIAARIEQDASVDLPKKALICDLEFKFLPQKMQYDDFIYLVFNKYYIAASQIFPGHYDTEGDLMVYDWKRLRSMRASEAHLPICMGNGGCLIPKTETSGIMAIDIPRDAQSQLALKLKDADKYQFKFVTVGDDNPGKDCVHSGFQFDVTIKYLKR